MRNANKLILRNRPLSDNCGFPSEVATEFVAADSKLAIIVASRAINVGSEYSANPENGMPVLTRGFFRDPSKKGPPSRSLFKVLNYSDNFFYSMSSGSMSMR